MKSTTVGVCAAEWAPERLASRTDIIRAYVYARQATHVGPGLLDGQLQKRLERIAQKKGRDVADVVRDLLIKDVKLLEELT